MDRNAVISAKRIVIKIGSSSLTGTAGSALDSASVEKIVSVIATLKSRGAEVALVSSGAIAAGLAPLNLTTRPPRVTHESANFVPPAKLLNSILDREMGLAFETSLPSAPPERSKGELVGGNRSAQIHWHLPQVAEILVR